MEDKKTLKRELVEQVDQLPEEQLREVLDFVESLRREPSAPRSSVEENIAAIVDEAPRAVWKNVPADGAKHHDHYIYGRPKHDT